MPYNEIAPQSAAVSASSVIGTATTADMASYAIGLRARELLKPPTPLGGIIWAAIKDGFVVVFKFLDSHDEIFDCEDRRAPIWHPQVVR
jgi:hypothetical protein